MTHVPTFIVAATIGLLGSGIAFTQDIAFFNVQDSLEQVAPQPQDAEEDQPFNELSMFAGRTKALRALVLRLFAKTESDGLTPEGQTLH
jgi:hypothetical protein